MGFEDRPTIENKSEIGNSAEETRNKIIKSGIAERILYLMKKYKPKLDPEITFGIEDCNFMVEVIQDPGEEKHVRIVIEHPNLMQRGSSMVEGAYGVEKGSSFGRADEEPLTDEQFNLIQEIVCEQKKNNEENPEE